jgi:hypothetical protein
MAATPSIGYRLFADHGRFALVETDKARGIVTPTFTTTSWAGDVHWLRVRGQLDAGWTRSLALGLATMGIDVVRGHAKRSCRRSWVAELQLRATEGGADPRAVDYARLADGLVEPARPADLALDSYYADGSPDSGGALLLEVRAPDRVGFLGSILHRLASLSLVPDEMTLDSRADCVFDRFQLKTADGRLPSDEARRALVRTLDGLVSRAAR